MAICSFGKEGGRSKGGKRPKWRKQRGFPGTKGKEQWPLMANFSCAIYFPVREKYVIELLSVDRASTRTSEKEEVFKEFAFPLGYRFSLWHIFKNDENANNKKSFHRLNLARAQISKHRRKKESEGGIELQDLRKKKMRGEERGRGKATMIESPEKLFPLWSS